jgi:hypothetical protein
MFFSKGLRDSSLIHKLAMKNPMTSVEIMAIANKYALVEEVTLDTRDPKKDKESDHSDQPGTLKRNEKKRKSDRSSVTNIEWLHRKKNYQPRPREFKGFLDQICIFHRQGKHKT